MRSNLNYFEHESVITKNRSVIKRVHKGLAVFLEWGVAYQEFENGVGNYSIAIILLPSGEVKSIPVEDVVFHNE